MPEKPLQELLTAHISGSLDDTGREGLADRLEMPGIREQFAEVFDVEMQTGVYEVDGDPELLYQRLMQVLRQKIRKVPETPVHRIHFLKTAWFKYAAAILVILGSVTYLWINNRHDKDLATTNDNKRVQTDVAPGGEKAVLTLADGSRILLDSAANGQIAIQGGVKVNKLANGQISYDLGGLNSREVMSNTMSTPKGGQYQVVLPDGTKVWLNASSSITFPTAFTGSKRAVKIVGEIYFEVAKNKQRPFIIDVDGNSSVEVLGTSFNVNSYRDEGSVKTSLLEGSVKVGAKDQSAILKPGEQAAIAVAGSSDRQPKTSGKDGSNMINVTKADLDQTLAWKNGLFNFNGADLRSVMRQLERWYDVEVQYRSSASDITFTGKIYRNASLSHVLDMLRKTGGVQFQVDGKILIVL